MTKKPFVSIISLLALAVICVYVSAANAALPIPQGIPVPQDLINELPSVLMDNINNPHQNLPSFEELKNLYIEKDFGQRLRTSEMDMIETYVKQNPKDPNAWILLGKAKLAVIPNPEMIQQCFLKASQLGSEEGTVLYHYAILRDINRSNMKTFNELYKFAQNGNLLAAFLVAETLTHGRDYFRVLNTLPEEQRLVAAATFYEMVINANFIDWGENCSEIARQRMLEIRGQLPQLQFNSQTSSAQSQPSAAAPSTSTSPTLLQNVQTSGSKRTVDDKYLSDKQKQLLKNAFDILDNFAVTAKYVNSNRPLHHVEDNLKKEFRSPIPSYTYLLQSAKQIEKLSIALREYVSNGIESKQAQNQSYFKEFYQKYANTKVFDWIEDTNKRQMAYNELNNVCAFFASAAQDYYDFFNLSEDKLKKCVLDYDVYGNGNNIKKALNKTLKKISWGFSDGVGYGYQYDADGRRSFTSYRDVEVRGYYENRLGELIPTTFRFEVYRNPGNPNLWCKKIYSFPDWFDYELH